MTNSSGDISALPPSGHKGPVPKRPDGISSGQHSTVTRERSPRDAAGPDHSPQHHHHRPNDTGHLGPERHRLSIDGERAGRDDAAPPQRAQLPSQRGQPPQPTGQQHLTHRLSRSICTQTLRGTLTERSSVCV